MAPIAFLEMCERSPIDCDHSGQADAATVIASARSAILAKLDKAFSGDSIDQEMATAAIKAPSSMPAPEPNQPILSYVLAPAPTYPQRTDLPPAVFPAYSEDISGSDFSVAAASLTDPAPTRAEPPLIVLASVSMARAADADANVISHDQAHQTQVPQDQAQAQNANAYLRINFDSQVKSQAERINDLVNQTIVPDNDVRIYQAADYWSAPGMAPGTRGDCEDYALEKRRMLIASGIPAEALSLAIVKTSTDIEHVVLILSTIQGDLVLDNLHYNIKDWRKTGYTWISRQGTGDDLSWISLNAANAPAPISPVDTLLAINQ